MAGDPAIGAGSPSTLKTFGKKEEMTPVPQAMFGLGVPELLIILAVVLLLFGGSRLAGLGKSTGRALKEFKEETKGLKADGTPDDEISGTTQPPASRPAPQDPVQDPAPNDIRKDI
jgi:sec-independent protein translocase protein TatA